MHDRDITVAARGRLCPNGKKLDVSPMLAGRRIDIKEGDEGIWLVGFMRCDPGHIDPEQRAWQTIDNPFGSRLSPMS